MGERVTFQDERLEQEFRKRGFLVVPYLSPGEARHLKELLNSLRPSDRFQAFQETNLGRAQSFHTTFFDPNPEYRWEVWKLIQDWFTPFVQTHLEDHKMAQANVFLKPPGQGVVHPHQNMTIVDETRFSSVSLWCPLQDVGPRNGTLMVLPGSQKQLQRYRNTLIYWPYIPFFQSAKGLESLLSLEIPAGSMVVLDDSLVHATPTNQSGQGRWAAHGLFAPREAELLFPEVDAEAGTVDLWEVEPSFYQEYRPGTEPKGLKHMHHLSFRERIFSEEELEKEIVNWKRKAAQM